jgi:3-hexulose-6-phosphate synthase
MKTKIKFQLALDMLDMNEAINILNQTSDYIDIIEIGTPFLKYQGINAVRTLRKKYPEKIIFADTKTMDTGKYEADFCFAEGADMVSVLGVADDETVYSAIESTQQHQKYLLVDLIGTTRVLERATFLDTLAISYIGIHSGIDQQKKGKTPLGDLQILASTIKKPLSVAGGIDLKSIGKILEQRPEIIVVGGAITQAENPALVAKKMRRLIDENK